MRRLAIVPLFGSLVLLLSASALRSETVSLQVFFEDFDSAGSLGALPTGSNPVPANVSFLGTGFASLNSGTATLAGLGAGFTFPVNTCNWPATSPVRASPTNSLSSAA